MAYVISGFEFGLGFLLAIVGFMLLTFKCRRLIDNAVRMDASSSASWPTAAVSKDTVETTGAGALGNVL